MNYSAIKYFDIANGAGVRTSLFISGCTRHCPKCFNSEAWDFSAGLVFNKNTLDSIVDSLYPNFIDGLTILGGEPLEKDNIETVDSIISTIRLKYEHSKDIWLYTGYTWDEIQKGITGDLGKSIINNIDVLVDGPFIFNLKDLTLRFKGSSNQKIIDCNKSHNNNIFLWDDGSIFNNHRSR